MSIDEVPDLTHTEEQVLNWRTECFLTMGFTEPEAEILATEKDTSTGYPYDTHKIRRMIARGCTTNLAFTIVTGL